MDLITLYSTHCPKCKVVEKKLQQKGINYNIINCKEDTSAIETLIDKGFKQMPILQIGEEYLDFSKAIKWIGEQ